MDTAYYDYRGNDTHEALDSSDDAHRRRGRPPLFGHALDAKTRQRMSREKRSREQYKQVTVMLPPDAKSSLDSLREARNCNQTEAIAWALTEMARLMSGRPLETVK